MTQEKNCMFCRIVRKEIPSSIIFENEQVLAFRDLNPTAPTHLLFVPKKHFQSVSDVGIDDIFVFSELMQAIQFFSEDQGFKKDGFRLVINTGKDGGQTVFHLHIHFLAGKTLSSRFT